MTTVLAGRRLKTLREERGLSQDEFASLFGVPHRQTIAQIEAGERRLSAEELVRAVQAFDVPFDFFTNPFLIAGEARFSWRREADMPSAELQAFELKAGEWIGAYRELSEAAGIRLSPVLPRLGLDIRSSFEDAEAAGERIAEHYELGPVPSARLAEVMQDKLSTLVLMVDVRPGISGAACLFRELGAALVNRHEAPGRRHYNLAHELFHILTWDSMPPEHIDGSGVGRAQKRVETMANKFASALLMPRSVVERHEGPATDPSWLNATATALGVTSAALKWRLKDLGRLSAEEADAYDDAALRNNGATPFREIAPPAPFSRPFMEVLAAGIDRGRIAVRRAATLLDVTVDELGEFFDLHGVVRPFDL